MTSISLDGAYPNTDDDYAAPRFGHPTDRRPDLTQVQAGLAVAGDGGIPLLHRAYDGGAAEVSPVDAAMRALREIAGERRFLLVGDSTLVSSTNLTALTSTPGVEFLATKHRVADYLVTAAATDPDSGKPTLTWHFDDEKIAAEVATDGWYALLTNLADTVGPAEILRLYKGQEVVERRYGAFKGPLAVTPMFLRSNQRIHALLHVICLALLVFSLIERQARLGAGPDGKIPGLYAGRPARPTGQLVLAALSQLRYVPAHGGAPAYIPRPGPLQQLLLDILGVDPTQPP